MQINLPPKKQNWFIQFWNAGVGQKAVVIIVSSVVVMCACCTVLAAIGSKLPNASTVQAKATTKPISTATTKVQATNTSVPKVQATAMSTISSTGFPYVGGPYSRFVFRYGSPIVDNNVEKIFNDPVQDGVTVTATVNTNNIVTKAGIAGPNDWTDALNSCIQLLPPGFNKYNDTSVFIDYHSPVGDVIIHKGNANACEIYLANS